MWQNDMVFKYTMEDVLQSTAQPPERLDLTSDVAAREVISHLKEVVTDFPSKHPTLTAAVNN